MGKGLLGQRKVNAGGGWNGHRGPLVLSSFLASHVLGFLAPGLGRSRFASSPAGPVETVPGRKWGLLLQATCGLIPVWPPQMVIEMAGLAFSL